MASTLSNLTDNESIAVLITENPHCGMHEHDFLELAYVAKGKIRHCFENREQYFECGDYFIVDFHTTHGYNSVGTDGIQIINCVFSPSFIDSTIGQNCDSINTLLGSYLIRSPERQSLPILANMYFHDDTGEVLEILQKMKTEYDNKRSGHLEILRCKLIELLVMTSRIAQSAQSYETDGVCAKIMQYTKLHYMENIKLGDFCHKFGYSLPYLSRLFREKCGMNFSKHLQTIRIEQSLIILANTKLKIYETANRVGYSDVKFFGEAFRAHVKMTPSEYRKMIQGK